MEWILKDNYVGSAFFDASASAFIMPKLNDRATKAGVTNKASQSCTENITSTNGIAGYGLGPEWMTKSNFKTTFKSNNSTDNGEGYLQVSSNHRFFNKFGTYHGLCSVILNNMCLHLAMMKEQHGSGQMKRMHTLLAMWKTTHKSF